MIIFNKNKGNNIVFIGDARGSQYKLMMKIEQRKLKDKHIFLVGNIGAGNLNGKTEIRNLNILNKKLLDNNNFLYVLRGDEDDKLRFKKLDGKFSNIEFLDDIQIVSVDGCGVLCVGGSANINRIFDWKWKREKPENFISNDIPKKNVDIVISHEPPDFVYPYNMYKLKPFTKLDKWLYSDIVKNRKRMSKIFKELKDRNQKIKVWVSSKYYRDIQENKDGIKFIHLDKLSMFTL
jgi:hypothetical protein